MRSIDTFIGDVENHIRGGANTTRPMSAVQSNGSQAGHKPTPDSSQPERWWDRAHFVLAIADDYCYIRLRDAWNPLRFFGQMSGKPPVRFGVEGFRPDLIDDDDPARHYTAFVFIGFWFFTPLAILILWLWEVLGFLRYGFTWSHEDMRMGFIGIRHGRQVRRYGATILPKLIEQDLMVK